MKIILLDAFLINPGDVSWEPIARFGELVVHENTLPAEAAGRIADADIVFTNRCPLDRAAIEGAAGLKMIQVFGTGYNMVDDAAARERGVALFHVPGYSGSAVAQMTIALLMELCCSTARYNDYIKAGRWLKTADREMVAIPHRELTGLTLGILGLGDIGTKVARIALAMGMRVIGYSRSPKPALEKEGIRLVASLDELLSGCDVLSLHTPLTDATRGLIDARALAKMRDGAILLNTSRGAVLNEADVLAALECGKLSAAGIDVWSTEPVGAHNALAAHPRCLATPHVGWSPIETRERLIEICGENIARMLAGKWENRVV